MMTNNELKKSLENLKESSSYDPSEVSSMGDSHSWSGDEYNNYSDSYSNDIYNKKKASDDSYVKEMTDKECHDAFNKKIKELEKIYTQTPGVFDDFESHAKKNQIKINSYTAEKYINNMQMEKPSNMDKNSKRQQVYHHGMSRDMQDSYHSELKKGEDSLYNISKKPLAGIVHSIKKWYDFNTNKDIITLTQYLCSGHEMSGYQRNRYNHLFFQMLSSQDMDTIQEVLSMQPERKLGYKDCVGLLFNPHFLSDEFTLLMMQEYNVTSPLKNLILSPEENNYPSKWPDITNQLIKQLDNNDFINATQSLWVEVLAGNRIFKTESLFAKHIAPYYIMRKRWDSLALMDNALDLDIEGLLSKHAKKVNGGTMEELYRLVCNDFTTMVNSNYGLIRATNTAEKPTEDAIKDNLIVKKENAEVKNIVPADSQLILDNIYALHKNIKDNQEYLGVEQKHALQKIMIEYLPKVMDDYFSIAPQYRERLKDHNNFTSNELLLHTLENIHETLYAMDEEINLGKIKKLSVAKHYTASFKR